MIDARVRPAAEPAAWVRIATVASPMTQPGGGRGVVAVVAGGHVVGVHLRRRVGADDVRVADVEDAARCRRVDARSPSHRRGARISELAQVLVRKICGSHPEFCGLGVLDLLSELTALGAERHRHDHVGRVRWRSLRPATSAGRCRSASIVCSVDDLDAGVIGDLLERLEVLVAELAGHGEQRDRGAVGVRLGDRVEVRLALDGVRDQAARGPRVALDVVAPLGRTGQVVELRDALGVQRVAHGEVVVRADDAGEQVDAGSRSAS